MPGSRSRVPSRVEFTLSGEEYADPHEAAGQAGMARRAYAAQAALTAAANGNPISGQEPLALVLSNELMRAAGLARRIATNLNQAVAKLNATGQPAGNLLAAQSIRRADHIDQVADAVRKALR